MPTLQQLEALQLQHLAEVSTNAWQELLDLLLQLQDSLPEGGVAQLLLLLGLHAQHAEQAGVPSSQAVQPARRQAAGLQFCLAALFPLQFLVGKRTLLDQIAQSLLLASARWHLPQQGLAVINADLTATAPVLFQEAGGPRLAVLLRQIMEAGTAGHGCNLEVVALAESWVPRY